MKVLYIAKNIPTPQKKSNRIIFDIAHRLSEFCEIDFLFPKERVPFWLKNSAKFSYLKGLKNWNFEGFRINTAPYVKLPFKHMQYWSLFYLPRTIRKYFKKYGFPDLIHAHYLFPDGFIALKICQKFNIPFVLTFRSQDKQYLELISTGNPDYKKALRIIKTARQVLVSNGGYKKFVESGFEVKCKLIPHGIDSSIFELNHTSQKDNLILITTVAEAIPRKNIDWIINAVLQYHGKAKIRLNIIGDGSELKHLKKLAGNKQEISFWGKIPHEKVLQILRESDIFALPSFNETFGLVYLEAAATQNAMIGYKGEGVWGVFEEEKEMLFCEDFEQFQSQLITLTEDKSLRDKLANNAFEKAKLMSWENVQNKYHTIYLNSLNNQKHS